MIRCLAVDDEPLALDLLVDFIVKVPTLKLISKCDNAIEAMGLLKKTKIDLLFLDIHMPDVNGFQLLKAIEQNPKIIFTTAYSEYGVKGFELDAVDYLLKPFSFERFKKAADKAKKQLESESILEKSDNVLFIKSGYETIKISIPDILFIEALNDYVQIFTKEKKYLSLVSMKTILDLLPIGEFARVHRSFIIPLKKITRYSSKSVFLTDIKIPIGDSFKQQFQATLIKNNFCNGNF